MRIYAEDEDVRAAAREVVLEALAEVSDAIEELRRAELVCERMYDESSAGLPLALGVLIASKHAAELAERRLHAAIDAHTHAHRMRTVEMEMVP